MFRGHTYQFDDFLASWMDRLRDGLDGEHTTVTIRLQKEVDKYQVGMYTWIHSYTRVHTYVRTYIHTYTHTHTYIHTYIRYVYGFSYEFSNYCR